MKKILTAIQAWEGDIEESEDLARLLIELAPASTRYQYSDIALVTRFDCRNFHFGLCKDLEKVFDRVWVHRTRRREIGYPAGANGVWHDLMHWVHELHRTRKMDYSAVLTTEGDAVPLALDWDVRLCKAWHEHPDAVVVGHWLNSGSHCGHINGNALFDVKLVSLHSSLVGCGQHEGWDTHHAPVFESLGWADTHHIRSIWKVPSIAREEFLRWKKSGASWLHGIKDGSAREHAREILLK
jgi:hypothetical protein